MDNWIQLTFPFDQLQEEIALPPSARRKVLESMANLLQQILSAEEEMEAQDDPGK